MKTIHYVLFALCVLFLLISNVMYSNCTNSKPIIHVTVKGRHNKRIHVKFYEQYFEQTIFFSNDTMVMCKNNKAICISPFGNVPSHFTLGLDLDSIDRQPAIFDFLLMPGDNIEIVYDVDNKFHFNGPGSEKCRAEYDMQVIASYTRILGQSQSKQAIDLVRFYKQAYDSIRNIKMSVLKRFEAKLSKRIYEALYCNCLIDCYSREILLALYNMQESKTIEQFNALDHFYNDSLSYLGDELIHKAGILLAKEAPRLYSLKASIYTMLRDPNHVELKTHKSPGSDIVRYIKTKYDGTLRDNVLTQYLIARSNDSDSMAFFSKTCLPFITNPVHRKVILQLGKKCKGSPVFDYMLTDQQGKPVRPGDLLGKVVVMDFWFNGCAACKQTKPDMQKLMAYFNHDTAFTILSVDVDNTRETWLQHIDNYTIPEALRVTTAPSGYHHALIEYYDIVGYPTLIVVDKHGKIIAFDPDHYSTTALFEKVRELVAQALKES